MMLEGCERQCGLWFESHKMGKKRLNQDQADCLLKMVFVIWYVLVKHLFAICFGVDRCVAGNML